MQKFFKLTSLLIAMGLFTSYTNKEETFSLTIQVTDLRNSKGVVQFALYNKDGTIPDEKFSKTFKLLKMVIEDGRSKVTFIQLPKGKYAVNIFHDENNDGKIKKGLIFPREGIGFSNYTSIGLSHKPSFKNASFNIQNDSTIKIKMIYM